MADESYSFTTARTRLEEIVTQVRKKDTSLEKSLDLLEEGVRLANACTELIDRADWAAAGAAAEGSVADDAVEAAGEAGDEPVNAHEAAGGQAEASGGDMIAGDDADEQSQESAEATGADERATSGDASGEDDAGESDACESDVAEDEAAEER